MDDHKTHTKNLDLINLTRDSWLILLSLPPPTSHKLQPLYQTFFKPLKSAFNVACQSWMKSHPGRRITVENLGELFKTAYLQSATLENATNGFKCTEIHPYNAQILSSSDFVNDPRCEDDTPSQQLLCEAATSTNLSAADEEPTCSSWQLNLEVPCTPQTNDEEPCLTSQTKQESYAHRPASSTNSSISFCYVMSMPVLQLKRQSRREESQILTGTPYKKKLANKKISKKQNLKRN